MILNTNIISNNLKTDAINVANTLVSKVLPKSVFSLSSLNSDLSLNERLVCAANNVNSTSLQLKLRKISLTKSPKSIEKLLTTDMVLTYFVTGEDAVKCIMLPFLAEYILSDEVKDTDKQRIVNQLKGDYREAVRIISSDFIENRKQKGLRALAVFKSNIESVVNPFKFF